jgi:hypothetical protein
MNQKIKSLSEGRLAKVVMNQPILGIFVIIFTMVSLNAIFNSISTAMGDSFPRTTFLFNPKDLFADYFKVIFSYPEASSLVISESSILSSLLTEYLRNNPYQGINGLSAQTLTHFHNTPLSTAFALINLYLMKWIAPIWLFLLMLVGLFLSSYLIIKRVAASPYDRLFLMLSIIICYPTLFLITRGHIFSGIAFVALISYLVLIYEDRKWLALLLLAVAVNIRPNAMIFVIALFVAPSGFKVKDSLLFLAVTSVIFIITFCLSNLLYPDYTISNFLLGLKTYHTMYVIGNGGLGFGSSLFGPIKLVFGASSVSEVSSMIFAGLFIISAIWLKTTNRITRSTFIFIICASYVLGTPVFADYHLGIFFAPLIYLYLESGKGGYIEIKHSSRVEYLVVYFTSIFMLIPKNYFYVKFTSAQVILNPIILLLMTITIIVYYGFYDEEKRFSTSVL